VEYLFTVHENVFNPPPKVKSAVIRMTRNTVTDLGCDEHLFKQIVKLTFNQRRKTLRNSIKQVFAAREGGEKRDHHTFLEREVFNKRPEQLSVAQFIELTREVARELASNNK
jgi:16S rRNA (adenine1518-N6/adenine1519-N6)-dimethyltransferase